MTPFSQLSDREQSNVVLRVLLLDEGVSRVDFPENVSADLRHVKDSEVVL